MFERSEAFEIFERFEMLARLKHLISFVVFLGLDGAAQTRFFPEKQKANASSTSLLQGPCRKHRKRCVASRHGTQTVCHSVGCMWPWVKIPYPTKID